MAPRWITYIEPGCRDADGTVQPERHHRVRATLVEEKPGTEGFEAVDVLGGEWPRVYRHFRHATPRPVRETWRIVDEHDRALDVVGVREVAVGLHARTLEVRAVRRAA